MAKKNSSTQTGLAIVTFLFILFCGYVIVWNESALQTAGRVRAEEAKLDYAASAEGDFKSRCGNSSSSRYLSCIRTISDSLRDNQRQELELVAQQQSARWTMIAAFAASIGLLISVVGVALVWFTFREQRIANIDMRSRADAASADAAKALAHAERSANASAALVNEQSKTAERQLRAYLNISDIKVAVFTPTQIRLDVSYVNLGSTPASNIVIMLYGWAGPRNVYDPSTEGPKPEICVMHKTALGKDQEGQVSIFLKEDDRENVNNNDRDFYIYGIIEYNDIFDSIRKLSLSYTPKGYGISLDSRFGPCLVGNDAD